MNTCKYPIPINPKLSHDSDNGLLKINQYLQTQGARKAKVFTINDETFIAVPQLATDIMDRCTDPNIDGGNSDCSVRIFKYTDGKFDIYQDINLHGNEDIDFFTIGDRIFLAVACIRDGELKGYNDMSGFNYQVDSYVLEWLQIDEKFKVFQKIPTVAAKGVHFFELEGDTYLGFAQGVTIPGNQKDSFIMKWNGEQFEQFQTLKSSWAYEINTFRTTTNNFYLTLSDNSAPSCMYKWDNNQFTLINNNFLEGGRSFTHFIVNNKDYLFFANIDDSSVLYSFENDKPLPIQTISVKGGTKLTYTTINNTMYFMFVRFLVGKQQTDHVHTLKSYLYQWSVQNEKLEEIDSVTTFGGNLSTFFVVNNSNYLVIANSLTPIPNERFSVNSVVYSFEPKQESYYCNLM